MEVKDLNKLKKYFIDSRLTIDEAVLLLKSGKVKKPKKERIILQSNSFYYGYISDTHMGHIEFDERLFLKAVKKFDEEKVDFVLHIGDHCEGMSGRPGHIYELSHIGFEKQISYCSSLMNQINSKIYGIGGNHDCHDSLTEVYLKNKGWTNYLNIQYDDQVISLNHQTNLLEYSPINDIIIKRNTSGELYKFTTRQLDIVCTAYHRILHKLCKNNYMQYGRACDLKGSLYIPIAGQLNIQEYPLDDNKIKLAAWILTDGSINKNRGYITLYQSKPKQVESIVTLLNNLGYTYSTKIRQRENITIKGKKVKNILPSNDISINAESSKEIHKYIDNKEKFPDWCYKLNNRQFKIFLDVLIDANGCRYNNFDRKTDAIILYGQQKALEEVQLLCHINGYRAVYVTDNRGDPRLNICPKNMASIDIDKSKSIISDNSIVWCLSVPHTNFLVRRNGKIFITGNCWFKDKASIGADVGKTLETRVKNYYHLGDWEGDFKVDNIKIKLFHANDGSGTNTSSKLEKLIDYFEPYELPNILHSGHYHKFIYLYRRGVHGFESGTLCSASRFMRGQKLRAQKGFGLVKVKYNKKGITELTQTFVSDN